MIHRQEGQNLVEFALLSVILFMILLGIIGFSLIFSAYLSLNLAVNTAGRAAAVEDWMLHKDTDTDYDQGIYNELIGSLIILEPQKIQSIIIYQPNADGTIGSVKNVLNGAGNWTSTPAYPPSKRSRDTDIGIQVTYLQSVIVPFVSEITGPEMSITKSTTFRIE
jgi:Flp pilus assembly protein TadG